VQRVRERLVAALDWARARSRLLDHLVRAILHYDSVMGSQLAAAATYYAFLSFFPLVALAFAAVGYVVSYVPDAQGAVTAALSSIFPGLVGTEPGRINVQAIARQKEGVGLVGLLVLLYSGLGWVSALRTSLQAVFEVVSDKKPNLIVGRVFDLIVLAVVGVVLLTAVGLSTAATGFTGIILDVLGLERTPGAGLVVIVAAVLVGLAANTLLFFAIFRLLPRHQVPASSLWKGALLGAIGFEVLKQLAGLVIGLVTANPLYGAFAIMIALLVWINYFNRLAVLSAAWAITVSPRQQEEPRREPDGDEPDSDEPSGRDEPSGSDEPSERD
jgi:membrane protein